MKLRNYSHYTGNMMTLEIIGYYQVTINYRSSVGDIHREHELEIQHLKTIHEQEVAALKAAFSHTR